MTADDIVSALEGLRALVRDPVTKTYALRLNYEYFEEYIRKWEQKGYVKLNPDALVWTPYIMGRSNQSHYDHAPIHTVAPREEEEEPKPDIKDATKAEPDLEDGKSQPKLNGLSAVAANGASQGPSVSPPFLPPGPPSTSNLSFPDMSSNHTGPGSRHDSAAPSDHNVTAGIPPTRFEIWPPINGLPKRRPGRPFGSTKKRSQTMAVAAATAAPPPNLTTSVTAPSPRTNSRGTPRRAASLTAITPTPAGRQGLRRGRSRLFETVGPDDEHGTPGAGKEIKDSADVEMAGVDEVAAGTETPEATAVATDGPGDDLPAEADQPILPDGSAANGDKAQISEATPGGTTTEAENLGSPMAVDAPEDTNKVNGIASRSNDAEQIDLDQALAATADSGPAVNLKDAAAGLSTLNDPVPKTEEVKGDTP